MILYKSDFQLFLDKFNDNNIVLGETTSIRKDLDSFIIEANQKLSGEGFETIIKDLNYQLEQLKSLEKLIENVLLSFIKENAHLRDYMEEYDVLDDSRKEDIETDINNINSELGRLNNKLEEAKKEMEDKNSDSSSSINTFAIRNQINQYNLELPVLRHKLELLKGLENADVTAKENIYSVFNDSVATMAKNM